MPHPPQPQIRRLACASSRAFAWNWSPPNHWLAHRSRWRLTKTAGCSSSKGLMTPAGAGRTRQSGRIRLLEETEGDGEFHTSTVYADNLPWASAVACYGGGVFVVAGPDLIYLKDSQDQRHRGCADGSSSPGSAARIRWTRWRCRTTSTGEWIIASMAHRRGCPALVPGSSAPGAALASLTGADFSFDPRALTICAEAGPAQSGLSFDNWGRKFTCDFMRPLRTPRYEPRYLARNPYFPPPPRMLEVASPATTIFRLARPGACPAARTGATNRPAPCTRRVCRGDLAHERAGLRGLSRKRLSLELPWQRLCRRPFRPHHSPLCVA